MLKDLDQRTASPEKTDAKDTNDAKKDILSGITCPHSSGKRPFIPLHLLLLILITVGIITFGIYNIKKQKTIINTKKSLTNMEQVVTAQAAEITLNNFTFDSGSEVAYLRLALSKPAHYFVANNNSNQPILLTLTNTKLIPNLDNMTPKLAENNWINTLKFEQLAGALIVEVMPMPNVELIKAEIKNESEAVLSMQFGKKNSVISESGTMKKMALPLTAEETGIQLYQQAVELTVNNKISEAIAKLQKLLTTDPTHISAREALATLLLKTGKSAQALKILTDGLARDPENLQLVKLHAQILTTQNKLDAALKILLQHQPQISQEPDYYGFIASLYQRTGQYMLAAKLYDQLAKLQPHNATWWIGLGAALESSEENNAAAEAYGYALKSGADMSPEVRAYVENKANQIK